MCKLSSNYPIEQFFAALWKHKWWSFSSIISLAFLATLYFGGCKCVPYCACNKPCWGCIVEAIKNCWYIYDIVKFVAIALTYITITLALNTLSNVYSVRKQWDKMARCQIWILLILIIFLFITIVASGLSKDSQLYLPLGIIGGVFVGIFQDSVKSAISYLYLQTKGLIHIGDWIEINSKGIDGTLTSITLLSAVVENFDTTTTTFPTYLLYSEHLKNYQRMCDGKTPGRRMTKSFTIDSSWVRHLTKEEIERIMGHFNTDNDKYILIRDESPNDGLTNIELYRQYLYHWIMRQPTVSHNKMMVRWMDATDNGLVLQVYAFLSKTSLVEFEQEQSRIIEHIINSLEWFDLQLYQTASAYDTGSTEVCITDKPATYRRRS